jgi:putative transposase
VTKYRWITARKAEGFPVRLCCRVLQMAPSSYYDWLGVYGAGATSRELDEAYLANEIRSIHTTLDDSYGSPRLTHELRRRRCVNHKRVERIVREHALYAKDARRRQVRTTIPDVSAPPMPDLIKRDFSVGEPGRRTCGDITYIRHWRGLAVPRRRVGPGFTSLRGFRHGRANADRTGESSPAHGR